MSRGDYLPNQPEYNFKFPHPEMITIAIVLVALVVLVATDSSERQ